MSYQDSPEDHHNAPGSDYLNRFNTTNSAVPRFGRTSTASRNTVSERLDRLIERACSANNLEPDLAVNMEIVDLINAKGGSLPRQAAESIVKLINGRNSASAILALALLDSLVKNCGYPFHLQISRKGFLNELVKKFPERPPNRLTKTQYLILEAIEEWRITICRNSKYSADLGHIRDMHRLLRESGYNFPEISREDANVLSAADDNLKSAEELEAEERAVLSAKLQELIHSGSPKDLQEANRIMKIMAGYEAGDKTDYRAKVAEDLERVRHKATVFEEMVNRIEQQGSSGSEEVADEIYSSLRSASVKLQKIIKDESDDEPAVQKLLTLNDYINNLVQKYSLLKKGNVDAAKNITLGSSGGALGSGDIKSSSQGLSLIDFDDEASAPASAPASASPLQQTSNSSGSAVNDLLGILDNTTPVPQSASSTGSANKYAALEALSDFSSSAASSPSPMKTSFQQATPDLLVGDLDSLHLGSGPKTESYTLLDSILNVVLNTSRQGEVVSVEAVFSSKMSTPITEILLEMAAAKSHSLQMSQPTASELKPEQKDGIRQRIQITGKLPIKLKWKLSYKIGETRMQADGVVQQLPVP
ncbi:hypothetical protein CANCADRAFT_4540 [Tortispora caseinolytica NRRL Y-17796]|uniref:VHS domain-containing protein n=1 Tax=Tortispora caseinolytica NRRL Y-17796 TaxID=767744 RepID=A0A1E4T9I6_9ASCO|nr:hypothetical protein CANCADRAFT_4540 [Tortispora caseinolytica NRRL Y-17796]